MSPALTTPTLRFEVPGGGEWAVQPLSSSAPGLRSRLSVSWCDSGGVHQDPLRLDPESFATASRSDPNLGRLLAASLGESVGRGALHAQVEFGACLDSPMLIWRITLRNEQSRAVTLVRAGLLEGAQPGSSGAPILWGAGHRSGGDPPGTHLSFFTNGWQSWGYAGLLRPADRAPGTRLGRVTQPRANVSTPRPRARGQFGSDMFGVVSHRGWRSGLLVGFLTQQAAFGSLLADLRRDPPTLSLWADLDRVRLDPGATFTTDWASLQLVDLDRPDPLAAYVDAVAGCNNARSSAAVPVGWCSWYYWFEKVTQQALLSNLDWAAAHKDEVPLDLIQLDDGFETQVGDWYDWREEFPDGLAGLSRRIHSAGFRAGLWLAPFIAKRQARILADHPDWILRSEGGRPANAGFAWGALSRALDATHPAVLDHVAELIETSVRDWGFDYLKLDFLYAAALPGRRYDARRTRAQALRDALERIRSAAGPDTLLDGCGCPLGPAVGIVDFMRISTDVATRWEPAFLGIERPFRREPDFPATRSAARNALTRSMFHRKWWVNDPDCLLLRDLVSAAEPGVPPESRTQLTRSQVQFLATVIAFSAGSLVDSDDLPRLSDERVAWLARLIPPLPAAARVVDLLDAAYPSTMVLPLQGAAGAWVLIALLNWGDRPARLQADLRLLGLPQAAAYHAVDYWGERYQRIDGTSLSLDAVPAHTAVVMSIRPEASGPCWVGDTLHISQGLALRSWEVHRDRVTADLALGRVGRGKAWLALAGAPTGADLDGRPLAFHECRPGVFQVELEVRGSGQLVIHLASTQADGRE